jgi:hypothetical protein
MTGGELLDVGWALVALGILGALLLPRGRRRGGLRGPGPGRGWRGRFRR